MKSLFPRPFIYFFLAAFASQSCAQIERNEWLELLQVTNYGATVKASFGPGCRTAPQSQAPQFKLLCPKIGIVPDEVIESAAFPFVQRHVTHELARRAIGFWSSAVGRELSRKMIVEIETGVHDQLTVGDLQSLDAANKSEYGRALKAFSADKEGSAAVVRAIARYEQQAPR